MFVYDLPNVHRKWFDVHFIGIFNAQLFYKSNFQTHVYLQTMYLIRFVIFVGTMGWNDENTENSILSTENMHIFVVFCCCEGETHLLRPKCSSWKEQATQWRHLTATTIDRPNWFFYTVKGIEFGCDINKCSSAGSTSIGSISSMRYYVR